MSQSSERRKRHGVERATWIGIGLASAAVLLGLAVDSSALEWASVPAQVFGVEVADWPGRIWELMRLGGLAMYAILLCSILALGVFLERSVNLRKKRVLRQDFILGFRRHWMRRDLDQALRLCKEHDISLSRILRAGLLRHRTSLADMERAIETAGQHEVSLLTVNLRLLGVIANLAPMLGLLGTVIGMIKAFSVISQSGTGNPGLVASGISEALITTAAGLIVGIPSLAAYHYFRSKIDRYVYEMEHISLEILEGVSRERLWKEGAAAAPHIPEDAPPSSGAAPARIGGGASTGERESGGMDAVYTEAPGGAGGDAPEADGVPGPQGEAPGEAGERAV